jgi:hypothetical protein
MRYGRILSAAVFGLAIPAWAATLTVDLNGGADYTDIQSAIDAAADGDTVLVKPGEYVITEPINFNRLHNPDDPASPPVKNIVVRSEGGTEVTTLRMGEPNDPERASVVIFENGEESGSLVEGIRGFSLHIYAGRVDVERSVRPADPAPEGEPGQADQRRRPRRRPLHPPSHRVGLRAQPLLGLRPTSSSLPRRTPNIQAH